MASKRKLVYITVEVTFAVAFDPAAPAVPLAQVVEIPLVPIKGLIHRIKAVGPIGTLDFYLGEGDFASLGVPDDGLLKIITRSNAVATPTFPMDILGDQLCILTRKTSAGNPGMPYQIPMVGDPGAKLGTMFLSCLASRVGDITFQITIEPMVS